MSDFDFRGYRECQVANASIKVVDGPLTCSYFESGGQRCERLDPHGDDEHWWSPHTIEHERSGNGWGCGQMNHPVEYKLQEYLW